VSPEIRPLIPFNALETVPGETESSEAIVLTLTDGIIVLPKTMKFVNNSSHHFYYNEKCFPVKEINERNKFLLLVTTVQLRQKYFCVTQLNTFINETAFSSRKSRLRDIRNRIFSDFCTNFLLVIIFISAFKTNTY